MSRWLLVVALLAACGPRRPAPDRAGALLAPGDHWLEVPGWKNRELSVHVPPAHDGSQALPLVLALHGGGGNARNMAQLTCPDGKASDPGCLNVLADREGFLVAYPQGTPSRLLPEVRTWNAGGGKDGYTCVSGLACESKVDDLAYFRAALDTLGARLKVDPRRIHATGMSNGGAMSHRLACELSDRLASVAGVTGANQLGAVGPCAPARPVAVLQIHGTEDPCWPFEGGNSGCVSRERMRSVPETMRAWALHDGCQASPVSEALEDRLEDGVKVVRQRWTGCRQGVDVVLYRLEGMGHRWPSGHAYRAFGLDTGRGTRELDANRVLWEFFRDHPMP